MQIKAFGKINAWLFFYEPVDSLYAKGNLYFRKNILTSNFTLAPFDELKLTSESYFVSPVFLWNLQKHPVFQWYDFCKCYLNN